jgi:hypothetical protein
MGALAIVGALLMLIFPKERPIRAVGGPSGQVPVSSGEES